MWKVQIDFTAVLPVELSGWHAHLLAVPDPEVTLASFLSRGPPAFALHLSKQPPIASAPLMGASPALVP